MGLHGVGLDDVERDDEELGGGHKVQVRKVQVHMGYMVQDDEVHMVRDGREQLVCMAQALDGMGLG